MDPLVSLFVFLATLAVGFLYTLWRPVKRVTLNSLLAAIPFLLFFVTNVCLGGSALHEAETAYELYEALMRSSVRTNMDISISAQVQNSTEPTTSQ